MHTLLSFHAPSGPTARNKIVNIGHEILPFWWLTFLQSTLTCKRKFHPLFYFWRDFQERNISETDLFTNNYLSCFSWNFHVLVTSFHNVLGTLNLYSMPGIDLVTLGENKRH